MAFDVDGALVAIGEAKWGETMGRAHIERPRRARHLLELGGIDTSRCRLLCCSGVGFDPDVGSGKGATREPGRLVGLALHLHHAARLAVDIGGTFTDVVLETAAGDVHTGKVLTTGAAPERAVMGAVQAVLDAGGIALHDVGLFVHGTTLATNAIIERKGALTALLTTAGFRDVVELAYENRFEQYDISMVRPEPLVPRHLRIGITERVSARGDVLVALDEAAVAQAADALAGEGVEAIAVGYLHAYRNPRHEQRTRDLLARCLPDVWVTLSSEVCPEIREYERFSTTCANAYVQPKVAGYLRALDADLRAEGMTCPLFLLQSSGGLCTLDQALVRPVMLVESGPAGGALLAARLAASHGLDRVVSFDMGGTTAKLCLIENGRPRSSRSFEVARMHRFLAGSGLPLRIPVIDMAEIGAGGGSIATVDDLGRVRVGPQSAAGDPGPACYGRGGTEPTVTDADVALGRIDVDSFAGGSLVLDAAAATVAVTRHVGVFLGEGIGADEAAFAVAEVVDENMANAARVHAIEQGRDLRRATLVAFGGAAPLHACRLADKLGISTVIVPADAGVGSAVGFLRAPVSYESVRTRHQRLGGLDTTAVATLLADMRAEAVAVVDAAAPGRPTTARAEAAMRYVGQGHEVQVPVDPDRPVDASQLAAGFDDVYRATFTRVIPRLDVEILTWTLTVTTMEDQPAPLRRPDATRLIPPDEKARSAWDSATGRRVDHAVVARTDLGPTVALSGPAFVTEAQTTTVVASGFTARCDAAGNLVLSRDIHAEESP